MQDATSSLLLAICLWQVSGDGVTPHTSRYGVSYYKRQSAGVHRPSARHPTTSGVFRSTSSSAATTYGCAWTWTTTRT